MTLLLVRHAVALRRADWKGDDAPRPLTARGYAQAEALPELLAPYGVTRILSSRAVRCVETIQPLAARLGLPVEERAELFEGTGTAAIALVRDLDGVIALCTHGDVIPDLLGVLAPSTVAADGDVHCEKGSTWVIDDAGGATYLPPPA